MIIVMESTAGQRDVDGVIRRLEEFGLSGHVSDGEERTVIGVIGVGFPPELPERLEILPGVDHVARITKGWKHVSREWKPTNTIVRVTPIGGTGPTVEIGGTELVVMAGPCSVESERQLMQTAEAVAGGRI